MIASPMRAVPRPALCKSAPQSVARRALSCLVSQSSLMARLEAGFRAQVEKEEMEGREGGDGGAVARATACRRTDAVLYTVPKYLRYHDVTTVLGTMAH